MYKKAS